MTEPQKKKRKGIHLPTRWVGECVCGQTVFEVEDGTRFHWESRRIHSDSECSAILRSKAQELVE